MDKIKKIKELYVYEELTNKMEKKQWINPESIEETYTKAGVKMEKKLSEIWWEKYMEIEAPYAGIFTIPDENKEKYDKILSIEAKIEFCVDHKLILIREELESELHQIKENLKLE